MFVTIQRVAALAAAALAAAAPAAAQPARYCDGALVANAWYRNVLPRPDGAEVEYHGQFQNQDPLRRPMRVEVTGPQGPVRLDLAPYAQVDAVLRTLRVADPSGEGAPSPEEVGRTVRLTCRFSE